MITRTHWGIGEVDGLRWKKFKMVHVLTSDIAVTNIVAMKYWPSNGTSSEVAGSVSATSNKKTVIANNTVIPKPTFSPDSGGRKNLISVSVEIKAQGRIKLKT